MKKYLLLPLCLLTAWPALAKLNVQPRGEIQVIASDVRQNPGDLFNRGTNLRVLAGLSSPLAEDVKANLLFQYVNTWGNGGAAQAAFGTSGSTLNEYWDEVTLVEANVALSNLFGRLDAVVGRQFYGDESSAVMYFGPTHYISESNRASSVDGAKLTWGTDKGILTLIAGRAAYLAALGGGNTADDKAAFYGVDSVWTPAEEWKLQGYVYNLRNLLVERGGVAEKFKNAGFYGGKVTYLPGALTLAAEYARNFRGDNLFAEDPSRPGYMLKADISLAVETEYAGLTPRGAFIYSADNFRAHGNYSAGIFIGDNYGDIFSYFGSRGVRMFNLGLDVKFVSLPKWTFTLDGFTLQDRSGRTAASYEGDFIVKYAQSANAELFAGIAYLKSGTLMKTEKQLGKDNVKGQLGMIVRF